MIRTPLAALSILQVDETFHARFSCKGREYEYWVYNSRFRHPLLDGRAYWVKTEINRELLEENARQLLGRHLFDSFTPPMSLQGKSSEREILRVEVLNSDEYSGLMKIRFHGSGFLHNMVRIMSGTLIDIGRGRLKDRNMKQIIEARDRNAAGITLPPYGLYFIKAYYADYPEIENLYSGTRY